MAKLYLCNKLLMSGELIVLDYTIIAYQILLELASHSSVKSNSRKFPGGQQKGSSLARSRESQMPKVLVLSKRDWGAEHSSARTLRVIADCSQRVSGTLEPRLTLPSTTLLPTMIQQFCLKIHIYFQLYSSTPINSRL